MPKFLFAKKMVTSHSAGQGMLIFPMTSQDAKFLNENKADGSRFSKAPDFTR